MHGSTEYCYRELTNMTIVRHFELTSDKCNLEQYSNFRSSKKRYFCYDILLLLLLLLLLSSSSPPPPPQVNKNIFSGRTYVRILFDLLNGSSGIPFYDHPRTSVTRYPWDQLHFIDSLHLLFLSTNCQRRSGRTRRMCNMKAGFMGSVGTLTFVIF